MTDLDLSGNQLGRVSGAELAAALASIRETVTCLDLYENELGGLSGAELAAVFASIPRSVTHLDLGNDLGRLSGADLAAALASIPKSVTHLNLDFNELSQLSGADLAVALARIPETVTHLDLSGNKLGRLSGDDLAVALARIPETVTHLDLGSNDLGKLSGEALAAAFAKIPVSVTHLNLLGNKLSRLLGAALSDIPESVTHLNLLGNKLGRLSGADLATALASIPKSVTHLNLDFNELSQLSGADLAVALASIPETVTHLNLGNDLGRLSGADLAKLLASIPNTVKEVRLTHNALTSKSEAYLKEAFSGLHRNGITISFEGDRIFTPGDREANDALLKKLRSAAAGRNLCLINTGESDFLRGMSTLVGLSKQVVPSGRDGIDMPLDVIYYIASFLVPKGQAKNLSASLHSDVMKAVMNRQSSNTNQKACIVNTIDLSEAGLSRLTVPQLQAIFADMSWHIRKVILSDEDVERMSVDNLSAALRCLHPQMIIKLKTNNETLLAKLLEVAEDLGLKVETGLITPFTMFTTGIVGSRSLGEEVVCRV